MQDERRLRQQGDVDLDNRSVFKALPHGAAPSDSKSSADHISHSGWGSRFGSGCPGAINVGNTNPLFSSPLMVLLVFQEGGGGKMERRLSSAQGQGPAGRRHSSSGMHCTPESLRSRLHTGIQNVHPCQSFSTTNLSVLNCSCKSFPVISFPFPAFILSFPSQM